LPQELLERDEDFRDNNLPLLNRFYLLFEGIYKYVKDLVRYLEDLDQGVFIQQTLEVRNPQILAFLSSSSGLNFSWVLFRVFSRHSMGSNS